MGQGSSYAAKESTSLGDLVWHHLNRMSLNLVDTVDPTKMISNPSKFITYHAQIQHYENLMVPMLNKEYYVAKGKIKIPSCYNLKDDLSLRYFKQISKWFQILQIFAYNHKLLKVKTTGFDYGMEEDTKND